jgi:hypothetical protein
MRKIAGLWACATAATLLAAGAAHAHHVQGKVWCDANGNGSIDGLDTPIDGVVVRAVSQTVSPGQTFLDTTGDSNPSGNPGPGAYRINLPTRTDNYLVNLTGAGLPGGSAVVLPAGGSYLINIVTGNSMLDHVDGADFLVNHCVTPATTTSSSSSSSSTSTSSTTRPTTPPSTTSTTMHTTTTTATSTSSVTVTSTTSTTATTTPLSVCEDMLDHFKCYKLRGGAGLSRPILGITDQFETKETQVLRSIRFCNPTDKNGEGILDPTRHLMCYLTRDDLNQERFRRKRVHVENQFGGQDLTVLASEAVCLPATKNQIPSALDVDRFKCYRVKQDGLHEFEERNVTLGDQFETRTHTVKRPFLLCNPADVEGQGELHPSCHMLCYKIEDAQGPPVFIPEEVTIEDEINDGTVKTLSGVCSKAALICVPSLKTVLE